MDEEPVRQGTYPIRVRCPSQRIKVNSLPLPIFLNPSNTLRHKLLHPKDCTPKQKESKLVYTVQCSEGYTDLYIGETKLLLNK